MRGREWRRNRANTKLARVRAVTLRQYSGEYSYYSQNSWSRRALTYSKRNSIDETIEVEVKTPKQFEDFLTHQSRIKRDNPKNCSCEHCHGIRGNGHGNSKKTLTLDEQISFHRLAEGLGVSDVNVSNFTWRSRGRRKQLMYDQRGT